LDKLSGKERGAFPAFLKKVKRSGSLTKLDFVKYYEENAEEKARAYQAAVCPDALIVRQ
jgi:hypothetical protein